MCENFEEYPTFYKSFTECARMCRGVTTHTQSNQTVQLSRHSMFPLTS